VDRTLAIGICRRVPKACQSELDHVVVYSSAVYVEANSTSSGVVIAASKNFVVCVELCRVCGRVSRDCQIVVWSVESCQSEPNHVVVYSSAVYVEANSTLSRVVKAASQNFVVSVVYVQFWYNCRIKTFFSFIFLSCMS